MSKLDDASWHYGGEDFPAGLADEYGATHIGGLESDYLVEETTENYRTIARLLDIGIEKWRNKPWWKVW